MFFMKQRKKYQKQACYWYFLKRGCDKKLFYTGGEKGNFLMAGRKYGLERLLINSWFKILVKLPLRYHSGVAVVLKK